MVEEELGCMGSHPIPQREVDPRFIRILFSASPNTGTLGSPQTDREQPYESAIDTTFRSSWQAGHGSFDGARTCPLADVKCCFWTVCNRPEGDYRQS